MRKPKMILFDYGQTLADEQVFDSVRGNAALLRFATGNKHGVTAEEIGLRAAELDRELGRFDPKHPNRYTIEIPNSSFINYLYQSMGIELDLPAEKLDRIFWDAAAPGVPTPGLSDFLAFLKEQGIRTGVITNISYCGAAVDARIKDLLPKHNFEFILATSEYMFRKPNRRIFELALEKAGLDAGDVWYAGDKFDCDVIGAREAGMLPVWYTGAARSRVTESDVTMVSHWSELEALIRQL